MLPNETGEWRHLCVARGASKRSSRRWGLENKKDPKKTHEAFEKINFADACPLEWGGEDDT